MSFVLTDDKQNETLAVVGDGALAEFIKHYFEGIGTRVRLHAHDAVVCQTYDDDEIKLVYLFEI
ncbi:MAG: hypothetical protein CVU91_02310 [Firmicutes bacterium HGW-Firmicutes-16]|nr:MAG: hypothetical protein CVU91_02310 [Firmicutes bacterium HGW-Firmicutes-16]